MCGPTADTNKRIGKQTRASLGAFCLTVLLGSISVHAVEATYYRYPGPSGSAVINDSIPPEAIPRGYDIIRLDGTVVKTVPPQLTEAQRKTRAQDQAIARARAEAEEKMKAWDESLLLRYSDVGDVEAAKERALNDIRVRISILQSNMRAMKAQVLESQKAAAEMEREGATVPDSFVENQTLLRREVAAMENQLDKRHQELDAVALDYDRDRDRFNELQSMVEKRRNMAAPKPSK